MRRAVPTPSFGTPLHGERQRNIIRHGPICIGLALLVGIPLFIANVAKTSLDEQDIRHKFRDTSGGHPRVGKRPGTYTGELWKTERTVGKLLLGETPYARCDVHSVMSADGKSIINDWIFMEERDAVNVAVLTIEGEFLVFEQTKYAIPGDTFAPVGGFINNGERPLDAARREVKEELGVGSKQTLSILKSGARLSTSTAESKDNPFGVSTNQVVLDQFGLADGSVPEDEPDWVFLGRYRTMANRGGGFVYSYLLMNAVPLVEGGGTAAFVSQGDGEPQKLVRLSREQLANAVAKGLFQEIKWAATMSLAIQHLQSKGL